MDEETMSATSADAAGPTLISVYGPYGLVSSGPCRSVVVRPLLQLVEQRFGNNVRKEGPYSSDGPETVLLHGSCNLGWHNVCQQGRSLRRRRLVSTAEVGE